MMQLLAKVRRAWWVALLVCVAGQSQAARADSCTTQAQMTPAQRDALSNSAHMILSYVQTGNVQGIRELTAPAVAAQFDQLSQSVSGLQPQVTSATITVDELYLLEADSGAPGAQQADFYCGSPVVVLNFPGLPAGNYALAIVHATGVAHPQQVALLLANVPSHGWMLLGLMDKPMTEAGHDGLWYWIEARRYAQTRMNWDSWFYYRVAANLLDPLDALSSPNLDKLQQEANQVRPSDLPGSTPMSFMAQGALFQVTTVDTSTEFGGLELDVHYTPDASQATQLRDPAQARQQVTAVMAQLLKLHPELREAFHGIWVHADQGDTSLFALELPMEQIAPAAAAP